MKKRLLYICLFTIISILFSGCSGKPYPFYEPIDKIESIDIVYAESSLDYTVIKTLSETEQSDFLEQLLKIRFHTYLGDPPGVHGDSIKITYQSGVYEMICFYDAEYVKNGRSQFRWENCDENVFTELLDNFLDENLP